MINCIDNKDNIPQNIHIFFASDDKYLPYLEVAIASLSEHISSENCYHIHVLSTKFSDGSLECLSGIIKPNIKISVCNLSEEIDGIRDSLRLRLRDYYSESIYYRLFISAKFPELDKAVYLDSDIVLLDDVAKLYNMPLGENLIGAVTDESVIAENAFSCYVEGYIGMGKAESYINSGVLVMNLELFRRERIREKFLYLLKNYNFPTVAPDQDYLNFLCRGKILYLPGVWNKHAIAGREIPKEQLHLVHYNMFNKPWRYDGVPYDELFWKYAQGTSSYSALLREKQEYTDSERAQDKEAGERLLALTSDILKNEKPIYEVITDGFFDDKL